MKKNQFTLGVITGMAAGVIAGILTAPKSGKETRTDLKKHAEDMRDTAQTDIESRIDEVKIVAEQVLDEVKGMVKDEERKGK